MPSLWRKLISCFSFRKSDGNAPIARDDDFYMGWPNDQLLWSRDIIKHTHGDFSFAIVQANKQLEDQSQVVIGKEATFFSVFDGHGGPEAARYVNRNLYEHLLRKAQRKRCISEEVLRDAFADMENDFLIVVRKSFREIPHMAAVGTCGLVGVIWRSAVYIGNLGDSRAVLGYADISHRTIAEQLTRDHNPNREEIRRELWQAHPGDSKIVVYRQGKWRVKDKIMVSRAIGDAYLKSNDFAMPSSFPKFQLSEPLVRPALSAEPSIIIRELQSTDRFIIFASDGLWDLLSNQEAVDIVQNNPRTGIARRLIVSAMQRIVSGGQLTEEALKGMSPGERRTIHDDITVIVMFIDKHGGADAATSSSAPQASVRGFMDATAPSSFDFLKPPISDPTGEASSSRS